MINIAICDDDESMRTCISGVVTAFFDNKNVEYKLDIYSSGDMLLSKEAYPDLLFLDIEMPGKNGLEVAEYYKQRKMTGSGGMKIVFLTSHDEVVRKAFKVDAYRFLLKDYYEEELAECLEDYYQENCMEVLYEINVGSAVLAIRQSDIMYITSAHNGTEIWTVTDEYKSDKALVKWLEELDSGMFIRVHKNCIVNMTHINYIDDCIYLYSGEKIQYSRRNKKELEQRFIQYIQDNVR